MVLAEMKTLIATVTEREPEEVTENALLTDDLGVDSLMAMEVMVTVDKKFKIDIPEEDFATIKTVKDAVAMVMRHLPEERIHASV
ncbi:MAG: acyl carrier protein [Acidobacteria bacterium]|nr:acyl carrier protein [Acidobacteriota bacterium]